MKPNVLLINQLPEEVYDYLDQKAQIIPFYGENVLTYDYLDLIDGILGSKMEINSQLLEKTPKLKIISNISVGYDNLDIEDIRCYEIMATNTPNVLNQTTADLIFGLLIAAARRIPELDRYVKARQWTEQKISPAYFGTDVFGKKLGIIGMGKIGEEIAKRAFSGFDMDILYHNRTRRIEAEKRFQATYVSLPDLLQQSDFVLVMVPLTEETYHLIGEDEFELMQVHSILINGSRGEVVDEKALAEALFNKKIRAAGLDVYESEPIRNDNPLLQMDNVVTLPHIGSATHETRTKMAWRATENLIDGLEGRTPKDLITK